MTNERGILEHSRRASFDWPEGRSPSANFAVYSLSLMTSVRFRQSQRPPWANRVVPTGEIAEGKAVKHASLFDPVVESARLHPAFAQISSAPMSQGTRRMMDEAFRRLPTREPHFVEQFQTTGFDQRVWELALFASLEDMGFGVDMEGAAPDFCCATGDATFFIEATTANASMVEGRRIDPPRTFEEFRVRLEDAVDVDRDEVAIRMGSALFSKAQRHYHDLEHVRGHPFVLAIEPFFDVGALWRSETALIRYLYGRDVVVKENLRERVVHYQEIPDHRSSTKTIPSGFFRGVENEGIAAVIFSNSHTTAKFNRMSLLAGYAPKRLRLVRWGYAFDPDPDALAPQEFAYEVGTWEEPWSNGLVVMHNPNARYPLDRAFFRGVSQYWENEGRSNSDLVNPHIYSSQTTNDPRWISRISS